MRCDSCGEIIGVDCFNPEECAWITHLQNQNPPPHVDNCAKCELNQDINRQKLEMWDDMGKGLEEIILFAKDNPGCGFSCGQMAKKILDRARSIGGK